MSKTKPVIVKNKRGQYIHVLDTIDLDRSLIIKGVFYDDILEGQSEFNKKSDCEPGYGAYIPEMFISDGVLFLCGYNECAYPVEDQTLTPEQVINKYPN